MFLCVIFFCFSPKFINVNALYQMKKKSKVVFYIYTIKREELETIDSYFL